MRLKSNLHPAMFRIRKRLEYLYGPDWCDPLLERLDMFFGRYGLGMGETATKSRWSEKDVILITYADMVQSDDDTPLHTLTRFCRKRLKSAISTVHILPFSPYSSDDGFSVIDYREVNPPFGSWEDVASLGEDFYLMFDLVLNHCSAKSAWFDDFIAGIAPGRGFFKTADPSQDYSKVVRPRSLPLLTAFDTRNGKRHVWTTFSADQVDLDFSNPDVLFEFLDILMYYVYRGASTIRLDAIAFLWKELGTTCLHLPQTHEVVKLFRDFLEMIAPDVILLTETNVPHQENISYFGDGDEAHMVYQFSLPPLLLHALITGSGAYLTEWAGNLDPPPSGCTYFNFTASHDGVGVRPLEGLIPDKELKALVEGVRKRGGLVSTRRLSDGTDKPYELNISYFDALSDEDDRHEKMHIARFLCSQTIMCAMQGIPGIYFHSLIATHNNHAGVKETGQNRTINRRKWQLDELKDVLGRRTVHQRVFKAYGDLLKRRCECPAFHPEAAQIVHHLGNEIFALSRVDPTTGSQVLCLHNLVDRKISVDLSETIHPAHSVDVLTGDGVQIRKDQLTLKPYECVWLAEVTD